MTAGEISQGSRYIAQAPVLIGMALPLSPHASRLMQPILTIVAPVFGLIVIGYLAGRLQLLSPASGQGLTDFAFTVAMPALMFQTIVSAQFSGVEPLRVWWSFFLAAGAVWLIATLITIHVLGRPAQDAPSISMSSTFGNNIMLGVPLVLGTFGPAGAAPMALVLMLHAPLLWLTGTLQAEATDVSGKGSSTWSDLGLALARELGRNPIILAIMAGMVWRFTGLAMPLPMERLVVLLGQAGIPASLVALGLTLIKFEIKGQVPTLATITVLKLVVMPTIAWLLAFYVFRLEPLSASVVTLLAANPTGANAFLFASKHGRAVNSASGAVALCTILAAGTMAFLISVLAP